MRITPSALICLSILAFQIPSNQVFCADGTAELSRIEKTYGTLKAYGDHGLVRVISAESKPGTAQQSESEFERTGLLKVSADDIRLSISNKKIVTVLDTLRTTRTENLASEKMPEASELLVGPLGAALLGSPLGQPQAILLHLLLDKKPASWIAREGEVTTEQSQEWSGKTWNRLRVNRPLRPDWIFWYDAKTALIGRIDVRSDEVTQKSLTVQWESGEIRTELAPKTSWSLDIPAGYISVDRKVAEFQKEAIEKKQKPESTLVGKALPDFPMEVIAIDGKTKSAKISDFKGKPILIDLWATWCGPCRKSFPELTQTLATLDDKSELQTILLSIDQKAEDGSISDHIRKGLKQMGVEIEKLPRTTLALDKTGAGSKLLGADAIPMTIIVDKTGIVRAVHIGITPATTLRKDLAGLK
jgi:thiol-disulfide isomerase/thioredoxin